MSTPKYPRYQDYVIKDGKLVGEFERMYQDHEDPWQQSEEVRASDKALAIHLMTKVGVEKVLELGCGHGHFTAMIARAGFSALGVDVSPTAIERARLNYQACEFLVGDVLDFSIYRQFRPELIVMPEITWCVLEKLDRFLQFLKEELPNAYLIHLLTTYPPGVQKYGAEKFTNHLEIMKYFGMNYLEWGEIHRGDIDTVRTFFLGRWTRQADNPA